MSQSQQKRELLKAWNSQFPNLHSYSNNQLLIKLGPFLVGLELVKLPTGLYYRPHLIIYPLYGNSSGKNLKSCLKYPVFLREFTDNKGLQLSIPYGNMSNVKGITDLVKSQIPFDLGSDVALNDLYKLFDKEIKDKLMVMQMKQPECYELKFYLALYLSEELAGEMIQEILKESRYWDLKKFNMYYGDLNSWIKSLENTKRNAFIEVIDKNGTEEMVNRLASKQVLK